MIRKLLLIGGDSRTLEMERLLLKDGFQVDTLGLHEGDEQTAKAEGAQAVLFAYPFSVRDGCVPAVNGLTIHAEDVLAKLAPKTIVLAGRGLSPEAVQPYQFASYMEDEKLQERNAQISAEGAACEAMRCTEIAMMDQKVLVTGYGRFARALAKRLQALGAEVWVAARRKEQRLAASNDGMHAVSMEEMHKALPRMHMVLNTVPAQVMGERELRAMAKGAWLLELASAPYGFDRQKAAELGLNCKVLPSIPAWYAPTSAGVALKEAVIRLLREAEV